MLHTQDELDELGNDELFALVKFYQGIEERTSAMIASGEITGVQSLRMGERIRGAVRMIRATIGKRFRRKKPVAHQFAHTADNAPQVKQITIEAARVRPILQATLFRPGNRPYAIRTED